MKKQTIGEIASAILTLFFLHSSVTNLINLQSLKNLLIFLAWSHNDAAFISWAIIISELAITVSLFFKTTRWVGLLIAFLVLLFSSIYIWVTPHYPHDFGGILNNLKPKSQLLLMMTLTLIAAIGTLIGKRKSKARFENTTPVAYT